MLAGDNSILQKATDAKQTSEIAEAKEQARIDIMAYITEKTANHQDASLDDTKIQEILSDNKSYVKEAGDTSFTTKKGEYVIPYSELYQATETTPTTPTEPTTISDLDKLKLYFKDKTYDDIYVAPNTFKDNNELGIKGEDLGSPIFLGPPTDNDDNTAYFYIQVNYNEKSYKVKGIVYKNENNLNVYTDDIVELP